MTSVAHAETIVRVAQSNDIRVAVVDDSAVVRGLVSRWIDEEQGMEVAGRFPNGQLAVDGVARIAPDVIILDIEMPVMDGLAALPHLLKNVPGVKIIIASTLTRKNAEISLKALSLGATDYIPKPESNRGITTSSEFREELLRKIKAVVPAKSGEGTQTSAFVDDGSEPEAATTVANAKPTYTLRAFSTVRPRILVIGSSTGGPQALARVIEDVAPALTNVPVVITQHMPATFTAILAERLGQASNLPSKEGANGEPVLPGHIYVAPGGMHMSIVERDGHPFIKIYDGETINFCKPAVDPLFESVAAIYGRSVLALVLTGMGQDGAAGGRMIADAGGTVIAQDQASSVVWGMPGATAAAGACAAILPLENIGKKAGLLLSGGGQ